MNVRVTLRTKEAYKRIFTKDVLYYANSRVQAYSDPYVPMDTGMLAQDVTITDEAVIYNRNYAKKPYNGENLNFSKDLHPLATAKWDRAMAVAKGQQIADDIQNYIERRN